ncbi:hypothetical protein, partial [Serratia marcescens]|uniref:hypothetical protein n=1 Tax=Serratia marcescens TaxID=615 RepID=UPI001C378E36
GGGNGQHKNATSWCPANAGRGGVNFGSALLCEYLPGWQQGVVVWWDSFYAYFSTKWAYRLILTFIGKP